MIPPRLLIDSQRQNSQERQALKPTKRVSKEDFREQAQIATFSPLPRYSQFCPNPSFGTLPGDQLKSRVGPSLRPTSYPSSALSWLHHQRKIVVSLDVQALLVSDSSFCLRITLRLNYMPSGPRQDPQARSTKMPSDGNRSSPCQARLPNLKFENVRRANFRIVT